MVIMHVWFFGIKGHSGEIAGKQSVRPLFLLVVFFGVVGTLLKNGGEGALVLLWELGRARQSHRSFFTGALYVRLLRLFNVWRAQEKVAYSWQMLVVVRLVMLISVAVVWSIAVVELVLFLLGLGVSGLGFVLGVLLLSGLLLLRNLLMLVTVVLESSV